MPRGDARTQLVVRNLSVKASNERTRASANRVPPPLPDGVMFVFDASPSMGHPLDSEGSSRASLARALLSELIAGLGDAVVFNVILFGREKKPKMCFAEMSAATKGNRGRAIGFLRKHVPTEQMALGYGDYTKNPDSNMYLALDLALTKGLDLAGRLVVITDGEPELTRNSAPTPENDHESSSDDLKAEVLRLAEARAAAHRPIVYEVYLFFPCNAGITFGRALASFGARWSTVVVKGEEVEAGPCDEHAAEPTLASHTRHTRRRPKLDTRSFVTAVAAVQSVSQQTIIIPTRADVQLPNADVLFILDVSASMSVYDAGGRLAQSKAHIEELLHSLPSTLKFDVLKFDDVVVPHFGRMAAADPENIAAALAFVRGSEGEKRGTTSDFHRALERAFFHDLYASCGHVFVFTDGVPESPEGVLQARESVLRAAESGGRWLQRPFVLTVRGYDMSAEATEFLHRLVKRFATGSVLHRVGPIARVEQTDADAPPEGLADPTIHTAPAVTSAMISSAWDALLAEGSSANDVMFLGPSVVVGTPVILLLDVSNSMQEVMAGGQSRLHTAKAHLADLINSLPDGVFFEVIKFGDKVWPCFESLVPVEPSTRAHARRFLLARQTGDELEPKTHNSNMYRALEVVFASQRYRGFGRLFFCTDGEPELRPGGSSTPLYTGRSNVACDTLRSEIVSSMRGWLGGRGIVVTLRGYYITVDAKTFLDSLCAYGTRGSSVELMGEAPPKAPRDAPQQRRNKRRRSIALEQLYSQADIDETMSGSSLFLIDVSKSMGSRSSLAKAQAAQYICALTSVNMFDVVKFGDTIVSLFGSLRPGSKASKEAALTFLLQRNSADETLPYAPNSNLYKALEMGFTLDGYKNAGNMYLFTDGEPELRPGGSTTPLVEQSLAAGSARGDFQHAPLPHTANLQLEILDAVDPWMIARPMCIHAHGFHIARSGETFLDDLVEMGMPGSSLSLTGERVDEPPRDGEVKEDGDTFDSDSEPALRRVPSNPRGTTASVLFLVDVSKSMAAVREKLIADVTGMVMLLEERDFEIIKFGDKTTPKFGKFHPADATAISQAVQFLKTSNTDDEVEPYLPNSNLHGAMKVALTAKEYGSLSSLYLFTDGVPELLENGSKTGWYAGQTPVAKLQCEITSAMKKWMGGRLVTITCYGYQVSRDNGVFLSAVTSHGGCGSYLHVRTTATVPPVDAQGSARGAVPGPIRPILFMLDVSKSIVKSGALAALKETCCDLISEVPHGTPFDVVKFGEQAVALHDGQLMPSKKTSRANAIAWVKGDDNPEEQADVTTTNMYEAVKFVFTNPSYLNLRLGHFYFFTDGQPELRDGGPRTPLHSGDVPTELLQREIVESTQNWLRGTQCKITCYGFNCVPTAHAFLHDIAAWGSPGSAVIQWRSGLEAPVDPWRDIDPVIEVVPTVFILDVSPSMRGPRMTRAVSLMYRLIYEMEHKTPFDVIAFADSVVPHFGTLRPADERAREGASDFVASAQRRQKIAASNLFSALEYVLGPQRKQYSSVQQLVILTDGQPELEVGGSTTSRNRAGAAPQLLQSEVVTSVYRWAQSRDLIIRTHGIRCHTHGRKFLQDLAAVGKPGSQFFAEGPNATAVPRDKAPVKEKEKEKEKAVVFVLDVSKSMIKEARLTRAKIRLTSLIDSLTDDVPFDVVKFGNTAYACFSKILPGTRKNRREAVDFVERLDFEGELNSKIPDSNLYAALALALSLPAYEEVGTVVTLTDAQPELREGGSRTPLHAAPCEIEELEDEVLSSVPDLVDDREVTLNFYLFHATERSTHFIEKLVALGGKEGTVVSDGLLEEPALDYPPAKCEWCRQPLHYKEYEKHKETCPNRPREGVAELKRLAKETCPFCTREFAKAEIEGHIDRDCPKKPMTCTNCKAKVPRDEIGTHRQNECSKRLIACPQGCRRKIEADQLDEHAQLHKDAAKAANALRKVEPVIGMQVDATRDGSSGVRVTSVPRGEPAQASGINVDDVIVAWDGAPVRSAKEFMGKRQIPGQTVPVMVMPGGKGPQQELKLTVGGQGMKTSAVARLFQSVVLLRSYQKGD